ncbi:MAG: hypothetical protein HY586_08005 [Candidatus Omnitrophica bacterium]|nr:hypothetical protein [Candidatus Omnitrophota bacterium]
MTPATLSRNLHQITQALLLRNSRFAQDSLINLQSLPNDPDIFSRILRYEIMALGELVLGINEEPQLKPYEDLPRLAELASRALTSGEEAKNSLSQAGQYFQTLSKDVQAMMKKTPNNVHRGVLLILAAKHYENIVGFMASQPLARAPK